MASLTVFWSQIAIRQRNSIFEYWNQRNKSYTFSRKLNAQIEERLIILQNAPEIGKCSEIDGVRVITLGHYSMFYIHDTTRITILTFWDNRQEPSKLLKILKS